MIPLFLYSCDSRFNGFRTIILGLGRFAAGRQLLWFRAEWLCTKKMEPMSETETDQMLPDNCQMALKEWAITIEALAQGDQVLLLRKGGIHEDGKDFRIIHREFLF